MTKRILLAICLSLLVISLSVFAGAAEISSADDMLTLMNTPSMWADSYTLTTDINLADATNGLPQAPIGNATTQFTGTFDGDGHTISGIALTNYTTSYVALFGKASDATIENLTVSGTVSSTGKYVAGLLGGVDGSSLTVKNCVNRCTVNGLDSTAGILGRIDAGTGTAYIFGCKNEGTVTGSNNYTGGIIGTSTQNGGAIIIEQCMNTGSVKGAQYVGGIVGYFRVYSASGNNCYLQDCINTGKIHATSRTVGGIMGTGNPQNTLYTITRCFNSGSVTADGTVYIQPIAGAISKNTYTAGQMTACYYSSTDTYTNDATGYASLCSTYVADATVAANFGGLGDAWVIVDGYSPELAVFHKHVASGKYTPLGNKHVILCYCGEAAISEEHTFTDGVCGVCGAEEILCTHENKYEVVETVATCTTAGSKYEFCPDCETKVSDDIEIAIDSANHGGTLNMALVSGNVTYTCSECGVVAYTDSALLDTVYVSENGKELVGNLTEQIGTSANPFKNFTDAMQYAAYCAGDAVVNILDNAEVPEEYITPAFDGTITVSGGTLVTNGRFVLEGAVSFDHVHFSNNKSIVIAAHENKLVMGEGITMSGGAVYLVGGYENGLDSNKDIPATGYSTDITLRSGLYHSVGGGNRFLDGAYSGTIKVTVGKTNPEDTLIFDNTLVTASLNYDGGDNVYATIIFDGDVDEIVTFRPIVHPSAGVPGTFEVDVVVKGTAGVAAEDIHLRGPNYTINVYADSRVDGAEDFAALIVGADNVQPYKRYCIKINGTHPDANEDTICDNCGAPTACEHESGEWVEMMPATCVSGAQYTWYCADCRELIETITKTGEELDADNHVSGGSKWEYNDGVYSLGCTACGEGIEQTNAPTVYVAASGNNAFDGTTVKKAVATVEEAVSRISNVGGTVVICGSYSLSGELALPEYSKPITFSGSDTEDNYFYGGFKISATTVISLGGETKFDNIGFDGNAAYIIECNWNDVEFGKIEAVNNAYAHIVLGSYKITESNSTKATATVTITEGVTITRNAAGDYNKTRFYAYIYLGDAFGADGISVSNKTATLNATDADIGVLYTMSTSSTYKNTPVDNCETTVNLYGRTVVNQGRTGDYNVGYADSTASLKKQTLNFFDNASIGTNYYIRNAENTVINVSTEAEGRTRTVVIPFTFYAYGTFAANNTPMNIEMNYSTHSFATSVTEPIAFQNAADALKVVSDNKLDECEYTSKVTKAATPTEQGTLLYSCSCGRSYTEQYEYSCNGATHIYLAKADGTFECTACGESFETVSGTCVFALSPVATSGDTVDVILSVNASEIAAAQINISTPEGFEFTGATVPEVDGVYIGVSEDGGVITLLSLTGTNANISTNLTFTYSIADTVYADGYVFELTVPEVYNESRESVVATPVSATVTVSAEEILVGDMNGDGVLTVFDALALLKEVVNNNVVVNADMNGDKVTNLLDVIRLFKKIAE